MIFFDRLYKLVFAYFIVVILSIFQLPAYAPAMRDFSLEVSLVVVILYVFRLNGNKLEYYLALCLYMILSIIFNENILEIILDLCGLFLFVKIFSPHRLIRTVYILVITLTIFSFFLVPLTLNDVLVNSSYLEVVTSLNYAKYILTVFPAYLIFEWALNGIIIEYIHKKKETS